jgi:bacterioferritin (cytochrome b1)
MKTFKQFLKQKLQNEQMDMPPAIIKYQKELGSPTQLGSYLPGMHLPKDEIKSPEDHIKNAENAKEIELTLKYRMGKNHVKYVKPEVLANALARTKPNVNQVKEILEYLSEYHDYITKEDIKTILNVVPDEIKGDLANKLEQDRQAHQNKRDNFFRKHYPNLKKGLDGDAGYFDSDSGKGGDYKTHYKSRK